MHKLHSGCAKTPLKPRVGTCARIRIYHQAQCALTDIITILVIFFTVTEIKN